MVSFLMKLPASRARGRGTSVVTATHTPGHHSTQELRLDLDTMHIALTLATSMLLQNPVSGDPLHPSMLARSITDSSPDGYPILYLNKNMHIRCIS